MHTNEPNEKTGEESGTVRFVQDAFQPKLHQDARILESPKELVILWKIDLQKLRLALSTFPRSLPSRATAELAAQLAAELTSRPAAQMRGWLLGELHG